MEKKDDLVHVRPTEEFLKDGKQLNVRCPIEDCDSILQSSCDLRKHLHCFHIPPHMKKVLPFSRASEIFVFHCPEYCCYYHDPSARYFTSLKFLKQHFKKVHAEKKHQCTKCGLLFGMDGIRKRHEERCGDVLSCKTCSASYNQIESLLTHCKRHRHPVPEEYLSKKHQKKNDKNRVTDAPDPMKNCATVDTTNGPNKPVGIVVVVPDSVLSVEKPMIPCSAQRPIRPKPVVYPIMSVHPSELLPKCNATPSKKTGKQSLSIDTQCLSVDSVAVQTLNSPAGRKKRHKSASVRESECQTHHGQSSTGIQTLMTCVPKKQVRQTIVGTQTPGDLILKTAMASADIPIAMESRACQISPGKSSSGVNMSSCETQTYDYPTPKKIKKKRLTEKTTMVGKMSVGAQTSASYRRRKTNRKSKCAVEVVDFHCNPLPTANIPSENYNPCLTNDYYSKPNSANNLDSRFRHIPFVSNMTNNIFPNQTNTENVHQQEVPSANMVGEQSPLIPTSSCQHLCHGNDYHNTSEIDYSDIKQKETNTPFKTTQDNIPCQPFLERNREFGPCNIFSDFVNKSNQLNFINNNTTNTRELNTGQVKTILDISKPQHSIIASQTQPSDFLPETSSLTHKMSKKSSDYGVHDNLISDTTMIDSEVQTSDLSSFICDTSNTTSTTAMMTQTENMDDIFDLFMNNMETQTAEDSFLCDMELADIQTQTNINFEVLDTIHISSETQTQDTLNRQDQQSSVVELTDMQTQTHFSQLGFEDIYLTDSHTQTTLDGISKLFSDYT